MGNRQAKEEGNTCENNRESRFRGFEVRGFEVSRFLLKAKGKSKSVKYDQIWDSPETLKRNIKVTLEYFRSQRPTETEEQQMAIVYRTSSTKLKATVTIPPMPEGHIWTIGWVQSCKFMSFVNVYGEMGFTSWEFPQLNLGLPGINDSDGESYPFYGSDMEICQLAGPITKQTTIVVKMNDSPASHVTLRIPSKHDGSKTADLTNIHRVQKFETWLVALNDVTNECIELINLEWDLDVAIKVNCEAELGSRVELLQPKVQRMPCFVKRKSRVPQCAKSPPDANHAQMLIYRPHESRKDMKQIRVVVAPQHLGHAVLTWKELKNDHVYEHAEKCLSLLH